MASVSVRFAQVRAWLSAHVDLVLSLTLAIAAFVLYVRTLTPGVLDGDSGEWQYMANILGVPHSTGYPLYILLAKLTTLLPFGNPAWRVNLFSALCAALTVPVVYLLAVRLARSRVASVIAAAFFALMPTLWGSATIAEVYALNALLLSLTLWFAIRFYDIGARRDLVGMAFCIGLALTNHRIAFFLVPSLLLVLWFKRPALNVRLLAPAALAFLLPLLLYLYIPVRAEMLLAEQSPANWELYPRAEAIVNGKITAYYNHTPAGLVNLITALDNRNKLGFQDSAGENLAFARLENGWLLLREQMDPFGIALALAGIVILWRRDYKLTLILLAGGLTIAIMSLLLRAESTRYYLSGAFLILTLFLAVTMGWVLQKLQRKADADNSVALRALCIVAVVYFALFPLAALYYNFARMDQSGNDRYAVYARELLLDELAPNAVLVAPWEVATPVRYFQYVEGMRPDVLTIHESPVRPQYQKLLDAAHTLNRPFYYAQFTPEDKNSDESRTLQAVAFPITERPTPQFVLTEKLNDAVRVIGYDWTPRGDGRARLAIYYRVIAPTRIEYVSELELGDAQNQTRGTWTRHPVSEYYPTYLWKQGDFYRDVYDIQLATDAPEGDYTAELLWYEYDAATAQRDQASVVSVLLSSLRFNP